MQATLFAKFRPFRAIFAFLCATFLVGKAEVVYRFTDPDLAYIAHVHGTLTGSGSQETRVAVFELLDGSGAKQEFQWRPGENDSELRLPADRLSRISAIRFNSMPGMHLSSIELQVMKRPFVTMAALQAETPVREAWAPAIADHAELFRKLSAARTAYPILICLLLAWGIWEFSRSAPWFEAFAIRLSRICPKSDFAFSGILALALVFFLYPGFFLFTSFPLLTSGLELQDPFVSQWTFFPSHLVIRTELLEHFNILWSNLRGAGMPLLGNEVQGAPLFPLTWLLLPFPPRIFPNVLVCLRLFGMAFGSLLLGIRAFRLSRSSAATFATVFALGMGMARWLNHPFQNGVLSGIWAIYFMIEWIRSPNWDRRIWLGMAFTFYCSATAGFPESIALMALMSLFVVTPFLFRSEAAGLRRSLFGIGLAFIAALGFACPQILALREFIGLSDPSFRGTYGIFQYGDFQQLLIWLFPMSTSPLPGPSSFFVGSVAVMLALLGFQTMIRNRKSPVVIGASALGLFYLLKAFPVWSAFNIWISKLPILRQSLFTVYFFPCFVWLIAVFAAYGVAGRFSAGRRWVVGLLTVLLAFAAAPFVQHTSFLHLLFARQDGALVLLSFGVLALAFEVMRQCRPEPKEILLAALVLIELSIFLPRGFRPLPDDHHGEFGGAEISQRLVEAMTARGLSSADARVAELNGRLAPWGLSTPNDGAMAILTQRMLDWRRDWFKTKEDSPMLHLLRQMYPYSWNLLGTRFFLTDGSSAICESCQAVPGYPEIREKTDVIGRAWIPGRCVAVRGAEESLAKVGQALRSDPTLLVVETEVPTEAEACAAWKKKPERIPIREDRGRKVALDAVRGPAWVVLSDSFYPGWRAVDSISGSDLPIRAANHAFRALYLPEAREYSVEFVYLPTWLGWAALGAVTGLFAVGAGLWLGRGRRARRSASPQSTAPQAFEP